MKRRQFTFIACADRVLVIDTDPVEPGLPSNARVRIFVEEAGAVLEPHDIEAARAALTIAAAEPTPAELAAQPTPISPRAAKGRV